MHSHIKIGVAFIFFIGIALTFYFMLIKNDWDESPPTIDKEINSTADKNNLIDLAKIEKDASNANSEITEIAGNIKEALEPEGAFVSGLVIDEVTKEPVPVYCIKISQWVDKGKNPWKGVVSRTIEDKEGRFKIHIADSGRLRCWVRSSNYKTYRTDLNLPETGGLTDQIFSLDPGLVANGFILDDTTGLPIEGAIVAPAHRPDTTELIQIIQGAKHWSANTTTDKHGSFRLSGLCKVTHLPPWLDGKWRIAAVHPDYAEGIGHGIPGDDKEIVIRLKRGFNIFGKAFDENNRPVTGVMILVSGNDIPMPRPVLTGADGSFRTPPLLPGKVVVYAGPPSGETELSLNFTEEIRRITIKDQDVEVNFGSLPDHVTWQGTLFDASNKPVANGVIEIEPINTEQIERLEDRFIRKVLCDEKGRFKICKLALKTYNVDVKFRTWASNVNQDPITFDKPGIIEKDIVITGATIKGVVVDKMTGKPVIGKRGRAYTSSGSQHLRFFSCPLDEEGKFVLVGLPPGTYRISVNADDYPFKSCPGYEVKKNQILDNIRLELSSGGEAVIKLTGFLDTDPRDFKMRISRPEEDRSYMWDYHMGSSGDWERKCELETGLWIFSAQFEGLGYLEREFEIFAGKTTNLFIRRDEFTLYEGFISVVGALTLRDGTPAPDINLIFYGFNIPGLQEDQKLVQGKTDKDGRFNIPGFKPGNWISYANMKNGAHVDFPDLNIPANPPDPYLLNLVLPSGTVHGSLYDGLTGLPLSKDGPLWWIFCKDVNSSKTVSQIQGGQTGPSFTLICVPECEFQIIVNVRGFKDFKSEKFSITEGGVVDVGKLVITRCGELILEIVDETNSPVKEFKSVCNGKKLHNWLRTEVGPGKYRFFEMPLGKIDVTIKAEGFIEEEMSFFLSPGKPQEGRFVLKKK